MTYLDRVETEWPLRIQLPIGTQVPFHCTASGKMYLSTLKRGSLEGMLKARPLQAQTDRTLTDPAALAQQLDEIAARGYATDDEEFITGMVALAVPVIDGHGRLLATLSIHAPVQRLGLPDLVRNLPDFQRAARQVADLT